MINLVKRVVFFPISPNVINNLWHLFFERKALNSSKPKSILVVKLDGIGDFVLFTGFLRELRNNFIDSNITLVVSADLFNLVELCPYVDSIHLFNWKEKGYFSRYKLFFKAIIFAKRNLWKNKFDYALLPRWDVDNYFASYIVLFSRSLNRIAYSEKETEIKTSNNKNYNKFFHKTFTVNKNLHEVELNFYFLKKLGCRINSEKLELWLSEKDTQFAKSVLINFNKKSIVCISPGALDKNRQWPILNYKKLVIYLVNELKLQILILGGASEIPLAYILSENIKPNSIINLTGKTSIRETAALLGECALFIGNDTGVKHIAAAMGTPVIEISRFHKKGKKMHNQSPFRFHAWGVINRVVQPDFPKDDCTDDCKYNHPHCIENVDLESVINAINSSI
jgi:heptosyltransferase-2